MELVATAAGVVGVLVAIVGRDTLLRWAGWCRWQTRVKRRLVFRWVVVGDDRPPGESWDYPPMRRRLRRLGLIDRE